MDHGLDTEIKRVEEYLLELTKRPPRRVVNPSGGPRVVAVARRLTKAYHALGTAKEILDDVPNLEAQVAREPKPKKKSGKK